MFGNSAEHACQPPYSATRKGGLMSSEKWYCDCDRCDPFKRDYTGLVSDISNIRSPDGKVTVFLNEEGGLKMVASRPQSCVRIRLVPFIVMDHTDRGGPFGVPLEEVLGVEIQGVTSPAEEALRALQPGREFRLHEVTILYLRDAQGELSPMSVTPDALR